MFGDDAFGDQKPESGAFLLGCPVGLEEGGELLGLHPAAVVADGEEDVMVVRSERDVDLAAVGHRLECVLEKVEEDLFHLLGVERDVGERRGDVERDDDSALLELGFQHRKAVLEGVGDRAGHQVRLAGTDGREEIADDSVQALELVEAGFDRLGVRRVALYELERKGDGVQGIADLVGDACCEVADRLCGTRAKLFLCLFLFCGDVPEIDDGPVFVRNRLQVENALLGIGDFDFAADGLAGDDAELRQRFRRLDAEEFASGRVAS